MLVSLISLSLKLKNLINNQFILKIKRKNPTQFESDFTFISYF